MAHKKFRPPSTRDQRPVIVPQRRRLARAVGALGAVAGRTPWLYLAASGCLTAAAYDLARPAGLAVAGALLMILESTRG